MTSTYMTTLKAASSEHCTIPSITFSGDFEIRMEFYAAGLPAGNQYLVGGDGTAGAGKFTVYSTAAGDIKIQLWNGSILRYLTTANPSGGEVELIVVSRVGGLWTLSVDGVTNTSSESVGDNNLAFIGRFGTTYLDGVVRNIRFYEAGVLKRRYKFDETWSGGSTTLADSSGFGQDGTAVNITDADAENFTYHASTYEWWNDGETIKILTNEPPATALRRGAMTSSSMLGIELLPIDLS